jgi:Mg-chelatase subunit ChlD
MLVLEDQLANSEKTRASAETLAADLPKTRDLLALTERKLREVQTDLEQLRKRGEEMAAKLQAAEQQHRLDQSTLAATQKSLAQQKAATTALGEGRFAGVDLSGKRVVLLVDMSGSMSASDPRTIDASKWPEVGRTVAQVLRSLQDAEKFQVILFADAPEFLLGKPQEWLTYDRLSSPEEVQQAMARVKPSGNTNLYAALENAFRFKNQGLDTIFLFSDGLPNVGTGLPNPAPTQEGAAAQILGKHVRDTIRTNWNPPLAGPRVKIHAVGFFYESPTLGAFLWSLARENGGSFVGMSRP